MPGARENLTDAADGVADQAVSVRGLVKRYGRTTAVDGLSFAVGRGAVTALLGPNGAGKTTTILCCEGYRRPDAGEVRVLGHDPARTTAADRARVGVMLQESGGVYPAARAGEILEHVAALHAHPLPVPDLVARLGLGACGRTPYRRLSGGERQRLALAMAVVGRPELVFLDEPTAGLDPRSRRGCWELVGQLRRDGVTVVLTTHLMDEAEQLADRVLIVDRGRLVAAGSPAELTLASEAPRTVTFTGADRLDLGSLRAALPLGTVVEEPAPGRYLVTGEVDARLLATLTAWCATNGVMPQGLQVGRRTLEDVFLDLTGHGLAP